MKISFDKMSGAGNDFVVFAGLPGRAGALAKRLCDRRGGVGADGLLVLERGALRPRLSYFNADGSAAFCGNGSRCAAMWLHARGWVKGRSFSFDTKEGLVEARLIGPERAAVRLPEPKGLRLNLKAAGRKLHFIDTGVPHAVVPVSGLESFSVLKEGRALRRHKAFAPAGANVDFISYVKDGLRLRTYERGVEDETQACGTGAAASAVVAAALGRVKSPVSVAVNGGTLRVSFARKSDGSFTDVWLEGPAGFVFSGAIEF